jgi:CRISPR system Cascade subunit CasA
MPQELSIRDLLIEAHEIRDISDTSPLVTVAIHRVLLALLHRVFGPSDEEDWIQLWDRGKWDEGKLNRYFAAHSDEFDLFHPEYPFFQSRNIQMKELKSAASLQHDRSTNNALTLFDHTDNETVVSLTPAEAARYLIATQTFAIAGLISREIGHEKHISGGGSHLLNGAVALVMGNNLFETFMLNMLPYRSGLDDPSPFPGSIDDAPIWERKMNILPEARHPLGYLDLLTWPYRKIKLYLEEDPDGSVWVRKVAIVKGNSLSDSFKMQIHQCETMMAYAMKKNAGSKEYPWRIISFTPERSLWRDSLALFQSLSGSRICPATVKWLNSLAYQGFLDRSKTFSLMLYGITVDKKKAASIIMWRCERLPLSVALLDDEGFLNAIETALTKAEKAGQALYKGSERLAVLLKELKKPNKQYSLVATSGRAYWSKLEPTYHRFLAKTIAARLANPDDIDFAGQLLDEWTQEVVQAARKAFDVALSRVAISARTLKETVPAEIDFNRRIFSVLKSGSRDGGQQQMAA